MGMPLVALRLVSRPRVGGRGTAQRGNEFLTYSHGDAEQAVLAEHKFLDRLSLTPLAFSVGHSGNILIFQESTAQQRLF